MVQARVAVGSSVCVVLLGAADVAVAVIARECLALKLCRVGKKERQDRGKENKRSEV